MSTEAKLIRVIPFSGKREDWLIWEAKYTARATARGFKAILRMDPSDIPKSTSTDADDVKITDMNEEAYIDLILSIEGETKEGKVAFQIVNGSKTEDQPDGNAALAWKRLKKKYASTTAPSLLKLKRNSRIAR
jgi:hypothetical protein